MTSMRTSRSYWLLCFIQSDKGVRLDSPNLCKGHLTGQRSMWGTTFAPHPFLSNTIPTTRHPPPITHQPSPHPTPPNPTKAGVWTFSNSLTPSSHKAIKLRNIPGEGTTDPLSQSIQWTGRSGAWHLYAIIHAISICMVKGKDSALLQQKGLQSEDIFLPWCHRSWHACHSTCDFP